MHLNMRKCFNLTSKVSEIALFLIKARKESHQKRNIFRLISFDNVQKNK